VRGYQGKDKKMRIAFIGSGNMGEAMISAVLGQGSFAPDAICACDIDQSRLTTIGGKYKVSCRPLDQTSGAGQSDERPEGQVK
jgi:pyrroline-5-carboxylate reductase